MAIFELQWKPFEQGSPGPLLRVLVGNAHDVIDTGKANGLEFPEPRSIMALIDTGASVTIISKTFANHCRLFQTSSGSEIRALGATHRCGEHAGTISFPGTGLRPFETMRIVSADFVKERHFACLIGTDILRNWNIRFDGRSGLVTIQD